MSDSAFDKLSKINVTEHIEKKGQFSYLSWPFAISEISKVDPSVTWEFPNPVTYPDGTMMVFCNVTSGGRTLPAFLPVMDNRNKAIANPNAFDINKAYQRCLVKGIALFGLGLYIFAGEDLPEGEVFDLLTHMEALETAKDGDALKAAYLNAKELATRSKDSHALNLLGKKATELAANKFGIVKAGK